MTKFLGLFVLLSAATANAAFLIEIDTDGLDDGALTYNSHFSFGGDTTIASQSIAGAAFGLTGGDSIFGGDGVSLPDVYVFSYNPSVDADNLAVTPGQDLGDGNFASGAPGGAAGLYNVYATWPTTNNVSGGDVQFDLTTLGDSLGIAIDQNAVGDVWVLLGQFAYTSGSITVTQTAGSNTFVSMRASGLLFEAVAGRSDVPEPSTMLLMGAGLAGILMRRRRNNSAA